MKINAYLSGRTKEDFERFVDAEKDRASGPARVSRMGCATYLIRKGLEAEKRRDSRKKGD